MMRYKMKIDHNDRMKDCEKLFFKSEQFTFRQCFNGFGCIVIFFSILIANTTGALHTLETPIREALLKPRNFNPHPYGAGYHHYHHVAQDEQQSGAIDLDLNAINGGASDDYVDNNIYNVDVNEPIIKFPARHPSNGIFSQGPHQFPQTLPPGQNVRNLPHPYAPLKYKNEINRPKPSNDESLFNIPKKQYAFSYTVRDTHSGDDFSHTQQQKNGAVKGTYKVQLPDGRTQVVRYTADNDGYRAEVSYLIDKHIPEHIPQHIPEHISQHAPEHIPQHIPEHIPEHDAHHSNENSYGNYAAEPVEPHQYQHINTYNTIYDGVQGPAPAYPTATSQIFVSSTAKPPIELDSPDYGGHFINPSLSLEQRKSISAQPTYVVSPKLTHISDELRVVSNDDQIDENVVGHNLHDEHGDYYKQAPLPPQHHHSVFYKTH